MDRKSVPCEKDFDLAERPSIGDWGDRAQCDQCIDGKSETGGKSRGETEDLENAKLNRRIASLLKQPRMIEFMERLRSLDEAVR